MYTDIAVIGGGASGLTAAIAAKKEDPALAVTIFEKLDRVGKKLLSTGNGRCNLSNKKIYPEYYHGSVKNCMDILEKTPGAEKFFMDLGVPVIADDKGRMYPRSSSAATVLSALRMRADELGTAEECGFDLADIKKSGGGFVLRSTDGKSVQCSRVIVAAGGYAAPQLGTDGSVLRIFRDKGYKIAKICPTVAPLKVNVDKLRGLKGVRMKGSVSVVSGGKILKTERGEIQFTENTVSGICVFNLARFFAGYEGNLALSLDLADDMKTEELTDYLEMIKKQRGERSAEELLTGIFAKNPAIYLVKNILGVPLSAKISTIESSDLKRLASGIKSLKFDVSGCSAWKNAQVTAGGIHGSCVDEKLQSVHEKGIYFCGEILDTDGDCGGYNLQWAWSSGLWAGRNCARDFRGVKR